MTITKKSFVSACKDFFGFLPGQKALDFAREVRNLNLADREEITRDLAKLGIIIDDAVVSMGSKPAADPKLLPVIRL